MTAESIHSDPTQTVEAQTSKKIHLKFHFAIGILLVLFLSIASVDFYYHYQEEKLQKITLDDLQLREKQQDDELYQTGLILRKQEQQLAEQEKVFKQWMGSAAEIKVHNEKIYAAAEIKHWIRMTVLSWSIQHDVESTLQLLQMIQSRFNYLTDSAFNPLKQYVKESLSALQALRTISAQDIHSQLLSIEAQLDSLPALSDFNPPLSEKFNSEKSKEKVTEKKNWKDLWSSMKSIWRQWVVVSRDEEMTLPLLTYNQRYLLNWYLHMLLTLAQTEAMDYQWRVCSMHLQQSIHQIQQFYSMESKDVQSVVKQLSDLRDKVKVMAQLPPPNLNKLLDEVNNLETRGLL